jgi:hypothetical protein
MWHSLSIEAKRKRLEAQGRKVSGRLILAVSLQSHSQILRKKDGQEPRQRVEKKRGKETALGRGN